MNLQSINKKYLVVGIAAIVVIIILLMFLPPVLSTKVISASFGKTTLRAGESTGLIVTVTNTRDTDISNLAITVRAVDPTSIAVDNSSQTQLIIGKGENRQFSFIINVLSSARPGVYSFEINVQLGDRLETSRISFEVKQ